LAQKTNPNHQEPKAASRATHSNLFKDFQRDSKRFKGFGEKILRSYFLAAVKIQPEVASQAQSSQVKASPA
jgi:hypothetical protein